MSLTATFDHDVQLLRVFSRGTRVGRAEVPLTADHGRQAEKEYLMTQSVAPSCPEHQDGSAGTVDPFAYDVELAPAADVSDSSRADSDAGETILEIMKDTDEDHWAHESGIDGSLDEDCPNGHLN